MNRRFFWGFCISSMPQPASSVICFADPLLAVKYGVNNLMDVLYTVTDMKRLNGFEFGKMLGSFRPDTRLHFIADTEQERTDAMRLMAENCILRPVTAEALRRAVGRD